MRAPSRRHAHAAPPLTAPGRAARPRGRPRRPSAAPLSPGRARGRGRTARPPHLTHPRAVPAPSTRRSAVKRGAQSPLLRRLWRRRRRGTEGRGGHSLPFCLAEARGPQKLKTK
ncbi:uncharacterized protein LOC117096454 [Trachypithecus francoisi]|uniref:uncharacterized protein LOC117096454 n=1 Tax=Trachypithecus francoisi TaxID=54180 RepID=UPI00141A94F1|nr:uncharacterized protein LOC117096454 [Trachypithecus francoisi]